MFKKNPLLLKTWLFEFSLHPDRTTQQNSAATHVLRTCGYVQLVFFIQTNVFWEHQDIFLVNILNTDERPEHTCCVQYQLVEILQAQDWVELFRQPCPHLLGAQTLVQTTVF